VTPKEREQYGRLVWAEFQKVSGTQRDPSSAEFHVIWKWMQADIPFALIVRAFSEFTGRPRRLEAMQVPVEKVVEYQRKALS
jgi:hypothetical protein